MLSLTAAPLNTLLRIHHLSEHSSDNPSEHPSEHTSHYPNEQPNNQRFLSECSQQLQDLGFLPGEAVIVQRKAPLGQDPIVVRVGSSTYALRRGEAELVHVV